MFQNITDLNLSSNNIEDLNELSNLRNVKILNMSCNKIVNICGLESMMGSLEKLVLGHNRIASLGYFKKLVVNGQVAPNLTTIDLNDNYIGELAQVEHLKQIASLQDLTFQNKNSNNPMCDFENYQEAVLHHLPQISKLDGTSIYELGIDFKSQLDKAEMIKNQQRLQLANNLTQPFYGHSGLQNYD
jgi:Leucine-rich repeat (LRR) protein